MTVFLYLPLLLSKLCFCESLTSMELYDVFDPSNPEFESPMANISGKTGDANNAFTAVFNGHANATVNGYTENVNYMKKINSSYGSRYNDTFNRLFNTTSNKLNKTSNSNENITFTSYSTDVNRKLNNNVNTTSMVDSSENIKTTVNDSIELPNHTSSVNIMNTVNNTMETNGTVDIEYNKNGTHPATIIKSLPTNCPEEEEPSNIGPYEVPTQRDTVLHIRSHLLAMYNGFHTKAMTFLKDIKQATQASWSRKMFCQGPAELMHYRRCVRWVGDLAVLTTKSLVTALETLRQDVAALIQGKICNISSLNIDPIHLIRILAAERVSLEFALPDFLRQLHACASLCPSNRGIHTEQYLKTARLTNQDFVMRHYYTQQNYNKQLNQQYERTMPKFL